MDLKAFIRDIPDFPEPGILFRDITPLLRSPEAFSYVIERLSDRVRHEEFDTIVAIESRGFLFGAPLAHQLGKPIVPVRKPGKLPAETYSTDYTLEYGENTMEMHQDGVHAGERVLVVDDLLATGGTLAAAANLVEMSGGVVGAMGVVVELTGLSGRNSLGAYDVFSLVEY
jgi:adenine phosphoribosyltransferase